MFGAVHSYNEKEKFFRIVEKVSSMKFKSQSRRGNIFKKKQKEKYICKILNCRGVFQEQQVKPKHIKGAKENKQLVSVICWS